MYNPIFLWHNQGRTLFMEGRVIRNRRRKNGISQLPRTVEREDFPSPDESAHCSLFAHLSAACIEDSATLYRVFNLDLVPIARTKEMDTYGGNWSNERVIFTKILWRSNCSCSWLTLESCPCSSLSGFTFVETKAINRWKYFPPPPLSLSLWYLNSWANAEYTHLKRFFRPLSSVLRWT